MKNETYHHPGLKQELINNGLLLLNKEGIENFSLRKVARMCGVSHTAPYKHFEDKDDLINEIVSEVWKDFYSALSEAADTYPDNPQLQITEIGKAYVKFMVENPEYLKFMFLSDNTITIKIKDNKFYGYEDNAFEVFKRSAEKYFKVINLDKDLYVEKTLAMWSMVHGMAILIAKGSIEYNRDYSELVEKILNLHVT